MGCCIQKLCKFVNSKMAAGGHFEFGGLLELAHTFGRGIGAQFFLNVLRYPNQLSNLPLQKMVTKVPNMTLLPVGKNIS